MLIKVCLCRGNDEPGSYAGWKINTFHIDTNETKIESEKNVLNKFSQGFAVLVNTLQKSQIDALRDHIEICNTKIYDRNEKLDADNVEKVLEWLNKSHFHVIHILTRSMLKKSKGSIVVSMQSLQDQCVLVSPCVSTIRPPAPVDFPCDLSIAVGLEVTQEEDKKSVKGKQSKEKREEIIPLMNMDKKRVKWQSCGSALDFVCPYQFDDSFELNNPWEASYYTTAIITLVLVKAYALGE